MTTDCITPTKEAPVFIVRENTGFTITNNNYKNWRFECGLGGETSALNLASAMEVMFDYIRANPEMGNDIAFEIEMLDGTKTSCGDYRYFKPFSYTMRQARRHRVV